LRYLICKRYQLKFLYGCQMISPNMTSAGAGMQHLEKGAQNATDLCETKTSSQTRICLEMHFNRFLLLQLFLTSQCQHQVLKGGFSCRMVSRMA
jgi:hypothetical protein